MLSPHAPPPSPSFLPVRVRVQFFNDEKGAWLPASGLRLLTEVNTAALRVKASHRKRTDVDIALAQALAEAANATGPADGRDRGGSTGQGGGASATTAAATATVASRGGGARAATPAPNGTPVTPAVGGTGVGDGADGGTGPPRKRSKTSAAAGRPGADAPTTRGGSSRRPSGTSRRGLAAAVVAAQAELAVCRARLAAAEAEAAARAAAAARPLSWEDVKAALKGFHLTGGLAPPPPLPPQPGGAPSAGGESAASAGNGEEEVGERRFVSHAGDAARRYWVPKGERMSVPASTAELCAAVAGITDAAKRLGVAVAAVEQQRATFQVALDAIPLGVASSALAAAAAPPPSAAGGAAAGDGTPAGERASAAAGEAEAAHLTTFARHFREWAALGAERDAAERAFEVAIRRAIAMKVTLAQLVEAKAGKPVRVVLQRYRSSSLAVDVLCSLLIDEWMTFISAHSAPDEEGAPLPPPPSQPQPPSSSLSPAPSGAGDKATRPSPADAERLPRGVSAGPSGSSGGGSGRGGDEGGTAYRRCS